MQQPDLLAELFKTMGEVFAQPSAPTDEVSRQAAKSVLARREQVNGALSVPEGSVVVHNPHTGETHITVRLTMDTSAVGPWSC